MIKESKHLVGQI